MLSFSNLLCAFNMVCFLISNLLVVYWAIMCKRLVHDDDENEEDGRFSRLNALTKKRKAMVWRLERTQERHWALIRAKEALCHPVRPTQVGPLVPVVLANNEVQPAPAELEPEPVPAVPAVPGRTRYIRPGMYVGSYKHMMCR